MSKKASNFQKKAMSLGYRGKEIFKPLNTGRIDDRVACVREWIANIFFYTKNGTTIMIDAGYNYDRLKEKLSWLEIDPSDIKHILITHQDTDHVGAVEVDSDGLFKSATLYLSEIENQYLTGEKRRKVIFGLYKLPMVKTDNKRVLRVLKKGGAFALHDIFSKSKYGDMQAFVKKLKAMGYEEVELIDTADGKFMTKFESIWMELYGSALLVGKK